MLSTMRRHISDLINSEDDAHEAETTRSSAPLKSQASADMATEVQYYPARMAPVADTSTRALRESPLWLVIKDAGVLFTMLPYLPNIFLPFKASSPDDELAISPAGSWEMLIEAFLLVLESLLLIVVPLGSLIFPGFLILPAFLVACLLIYLTCWPLQGPDLCYSTVDTTTSTLAGNRSDERWLFVNGCVTNHAGLQKNIDRLSKTFGRNVIGIHNKSFGLVADLLECLIQRCFDYKTRDVRIAYLSLKPVLMDVTVKKVVLIGHSQGGLIISLGANSFIAWTS